MEVPDSKREIKFLNLLLSKLRKIILRVLSEAPHTKVLSLLLLLMAAICHEAALQVELRSVLEKAEVLLKDIHLLENIVHLLQNGHLIDLIVMVEETFRGIMTGTQATEADMNTHHPNVVTGVHLEEEGALLDMNAREAGAGQFLVALVPTEVVGGAIAEVRCAVLALQIGARCSVTN